MFFSPRWTWTWPCWTASGRPTPSSDPGERGPKSSDATKAVLGSGGSPGELLGARRPGKLAQLQERLRWYRYLFLGRAKPSTHLRALARLSSAELKDGPEPVRALSDYIKTKLGL